MMNIPTSMLTIVPVPKHHVLSNLSTFMSDASTNATKTPAGTDQSIVRQKIAHQMISARLYVGSRKVASVVLVVSVVSVKDALILIFGPPLFLHCAKFSIS